MRKRIFCLTLLFLIELLASLAVSAPTVNVPDDHALETDLNKAAGDAITATDTEAGMSDVSGFTFTPNNTSKGNSTKEINAAGCSWCSIPCEIKTRCCGCRY